MTIIITIAIALANFWHEQEKKRGLVEMAKRINAELERKGIKHKVESNVDDYGKESPKQANNKWKIFERFIAPTVTVVADALIAYLATKDLLVTLLVAGISGAFFKGFFDGILNKSRGNKFFKESSKDTKKWKDRISIGLFVILCIVFILKIG